MIRDDDDLPPPTLYLYSYDIHEGHTGTRELWFEASLSTRRAPTSPLTT